MRFYASFIPGLQDLVAGIIGRTRVVRIMDGAIEFEARKQWGTDGRDGSGCLNNIFEVIDSVEIGSKNPIERHMRILLNNKRLSLHGISGAGSFRIVTSYANKPVSIDAKLKSGMEKLIGQSSVLSLNRSGMNKDGNIEFWFLYRSEGICYFMKRLTYHGAYDKILKKGELRPELAYALNLISEPSDSDVFLDPFCGSGSIPLQRAEHFKARTIYAFDIDAGAIAYLKSRKSKIKTLDVELICERADATKLRLPAGGVDRIVTDPPWGLYAMTEGGALDLYNKVMPRFAHVLRPGGALTMLSARNVGARDAFVSNPHFSLKSEYHILVSGKKADIYTLIRE